MAGNNNFADNLLSGLLNPKGNLGDFQHAARLYVDDYFRLAPKTKFLYFVNWKINPEVQKLFLKGAQQKHLLEAALLVKTIDLPSLDMRVETKNSYNRKKNFHTGITYDPINVTMHDDNYSTTTALLEAYYRYNYADGNAIKEENDPRYASRNTYGNSETRKYKYGLDYSYAGDNNFRTKSPFFDSFDIYQFSRKFFTKFSLINPIITSIQHDTMDQSDGQTPSQNRFSLMYEAVVYDQGEIKDGDPAGFAEIHYDKTPSPLSLEGGGISSFFGSGGAIEGIGKLGLLLGGENPSLLTAAIVAGNLANNSKDLDSERFKAEATAIAVNQITSIQPEDVQGQNSAISAVVPLNETNNDVTETEVRKVN